VILYNSASQSEIFSSTDSSIRPTVFSDGYVVLLAQIQQTVSCQLQLANFPFDTQSCTAQFAFLEISQTGDVPAIQAPRPRAVLDGYSRTGEFNLTDAKAKACSDDCVVLLETPLATVNVKLMYSRRSSYYVTTMIIPAFALTRKLHLVVRHI
jgi:hypothetical protein